VQGVAACQSLATEGKSRIQKGEGIDLGALIGLVPGGSAVEFLGKEGADAQATLRGDAAGTLQQLLVERERDVTLGHPVQQYGSSRGYSKAWAKVLDPENDAVTPRTLQKAALAVGREIRFELP